MNEKRPAEKLVFFVYPRASKAGIRFGALPRPPRIAFEKGWKILCSSDMQNG